ncbi:glycoside hydrolase family 19 protein [Rhodoligotrophos ferricapiens]|uniref:glycoside hydrolase family 19 protein n=1 Tax=Rhodoligotrophos ferricapiens TaxID=3069264 RepID=UPI00315DD33A
MMINRETFFTYVRRAPFGGRLTQQQVDGLNAMLAFWEAWPKAVDRRHLAYILATVHHETGGRFAPVREGFATTDAGARKVVAKRAYGKPQANGHVYYGRGFVQLTWFQNYKKMGDLLGLDLADNPDLALDLHVSTEILFEGMAQGLFTGKKLSDYFNETADDPVNARRIVNGTDKARLIAGYHRNFLDAIKAAEAIVAPPDVSPQAAKADGPPLAKDKTVWSVIGGAAASFCAGIFGAINNPYAFGAFAVGAVMAVGLAIYFRKEIREQFGG